MASDDEGPKVDARAEPKVQLRSVMWSFPQTPQYKMLVVGQANAGKSCFLTFLSNFHSVLEGKIPDDVILKLRSRARGSSTSVAKVSNISIEGVTLQVIDTPGFPDNAGVPDVLQLGNEFERQLRDALHDAQYLNCIVFVIQGTQAEMHPSVAETLGVISSLMPGKISQQVIFLFTRVDSAQRRAFPVPALSEVVRGEPICIHLDNPLGGLAAMSEEQLMERLADQEANGASEIASELRVGAKAVTELLTVAKDFKPVHVASREGFAQVPAYVWIGMLTMFTLVVLGKRRAFLVVVFSMVYLFWRGGGFQQVDTRQLTGRRLLEMEAQTPVLE